MTEPNDFILADAPEELLRLASSPTTPTKQMAPHLWADRWGPLYQQFRIYYAGSYRGCIFQETPAHHDWSAERAISGEFETGLPSRSAAINWLVPEHTTKARIGRQTAQGGTKMNRKNETTGEAFASGTILTITLDGAVSTGTVQEDGSLIDALGAAFKSPALWHKKTVGRYMPRKWAVSEAIAAKAEEEAPKAPKAPRKAKAKLPTADEAKAIAAAMVAEIKEEMAEAKAPKAKAPRAPRKPKTEAEVEEAIAGSTAALAPEAIEALVADAAVTSEPIEEAA